MTNTKIDPAILDQAAQIAQAYGYRSGNAQHAAATTASEIRWIADALGTDAVLTEDIAAAVQAYDDRPQIDPPTDDDAATGDLMTRLLFAVARYSDAIQKYNRAADDQAAQAVWRACAGVVARLRASAVEKLITDFTTLYPEALAAYSQAPSTVDRLDILSVDDFARLKAAQEIGARLDAMWQKVNRLERGVRFETASVVLPVDQKPSALAKDGLLLDGQTLGFSHPVAEGLGVGAPSYQADRGGR
ncbi:hypothetical protein ACFV4N_23860 [Actinosynnema sp. NPDC059797]